MSDELSVIWHLNFRLKRGGGGFWWQHTILWNEVFGMGSLPLWVIDAKNLGVLTDTCIGPMCHLQNHGRVPRSSHPFLQYMQVQPYDSTGVAWRGTSIMDMHDVHQDIPRPFFKRACPSPNDTFFCFLFQLILITFALNDPFYYARQIPLFHFLCSPISDPFLKIKSYSEGSVCVAFQRWLLFCGMKNTWILQIPIFGTICALYVTFER